MSKKPSLELICDSREQDSLINEFKAGIFDFVSISGLPVADYMIKLEDKECPILFERKGLGDLFGTLTHGIKRFKRELEKAEEFNCQVVLLIEGTMRDIVDGYEHSSVEGQQILRTVFTLFVKYGVIPVFCPDRRSMAKFIEEIATALQRNYSNPVPQTKHSVMPVGQQAPRSDAGAASEL